jgi:hypothetical protein
MKDEVLKAYGGRDAKLIVATVHKHHLLSGMVDIDSIHYGFRYASMSEGGLHGLQSQWGGGHERDSRLLKLCAQLNNIVREIDKLHNEKS